MSNAKDVQAALDEALADDKADSQTAKQQDTEVTQAVKTALGGKADDASDDSADEKSAKDEKGNQTVPLERLSKVVKQKNEALEQLKTLEEKVKTATTRETELTAKVQNLETQAQIVQAIRNLAQNEKYRSHVVAIDKALQGIEDDTEVAKESGDNKALAAAEKRFEAKIAELEDLQAEQRADNLWNETNAMASQVLARLPAEYSDEDRNTISKLWTPKVDWDLIEEKGSAAIASALNSSLAEVIKEYGTPRGALVTKTTKEIEARVPEARIASPEVAVKEILGKDWSALKDGKPVLSDEEFAQAAGELMRKTRGR